MGKEFTYKGKTYRMVPLEEASYIGAICLECPLRKSCDSLVERRILINLKGGFCGTLNAHPVLLENPVLIENELKLFLKKTGPFRNSNEESDWNEVLTIAKSWGWIQG